MTDRNRIFYEVEGKKFARNIEAFFYLKEIRKNFPKAKPKFILDLFYLFFSNYFDKSMKLLEY